MNLLGNDVVDLKTADARCKSLDTRFLQRVLTPDELQAVLRADNPDTLLWGFWAAKEAAFKALSKTAPEVTSAPRKFPVTFEPYGDAGTARGSVITPCGPVRIMISINHDAVHCIAVSGRSPVFSGIVSDLAEIPAGNGPVSARESAAVRKLAGARIAAFLGCCPGAVRIMRKNEYRGLGPPRVYVNGEVSPIDISLSHDGRFAAYAFKMAIS